MNCDGTGVIHTIGHSTRPIETFLTLLKTHAIARLVDVRRWPMSRRHPQFNREALDASLKENGIDYLWRGDLGGSRKPDADSPNTAWRVGAFRAYADFMLTAEFHSTMAEMETLAGSGRIALMCAEALPWQCHRQLIADAFLVRGWSVHHIFDDACREHKLPLFARPDGTRIIYGGLL
jgi:uncharacterized protein (DUF488 family)